MKINKTFLKSSFIYTLAGTLPLASAVILLPLYTTYLTTADYGLLSIYLVFSLLIQIITTYSFDTSLYIHYHEFKNDKTKLSSFVSSAFIFMIALGLGVAIVFSLAGDFIFDQVFKDVEINFYPYGLLAAATGIFQAIFKVNTNLLQSREQPQLFLWSNIISFALIVIFTFVGLKLYPNTLIGPITGRALAAAISASWALIRIFKEFGIHFNFTLLRSSFSFNFYTFIYQLLQWTINNFDRPLMVFFVTLEQVGVYDFAVKCMIVIELLLNSLHNSFYPKVVNSMMAQEEKKSSQEINRYYHGFISVVMLLICGCILIFPWLIEAFVKKKGYLDALQYLPYIAITYIFRAIRLYFAVPYGILKYAKPLPKIYIIVSAIKIILIILLIGEYGVYGIIGASFVSAALEIILLIQNIKEKFLFQYNQFKIIIAPLILFAMILILEPLVGGPHAFFIHAFYLVSCSLLLWWVYRNEIKLIDPFKILK